MEGCTCANQLGGGKANTARRASLSSRKFQASFWCCGQGRAPVSRAVRSGRGLPCCLANAMKIYRRFWCCQQQAALRWSVVGAGGGEWRRSVEMVGDRLGKGPLVGGERGSARMLRREAIAGSQLPARLSPAGEVDRVSEALMVNSRFGATANSLLSHGRIDVTPVAQ